MNDEILDPEEEANQEIGGPGETPQETAFRRSGEMEFCGSKLRWSYTCETAAEALGLKFYRLNEEDLYAKKNPRKELLADESAPLTAEERAAIEAEASEIPWYDGIIRDAGIAVWLGLQPDATVRRARRKPMDYETAIDKFAETNGIYRGGANLMEAIVVLMQTVADVAASRPAPDKGAEANREIGGPGGKV